ncbi:GNAT family N-acetyltransferase [Pontibacter sp. HSC-36F09]|uniref:GNAT family N-acetyltransferase n=1 Tax=Pontibacter sp. HSC-36F09 TaxID=2910966 RepID=UPI00209D4391|nr:GNAT family N-acetyltransferase [Pontibacter sp. HSC-36F09]MCP2042351.1 ribosomal protein S18 acetylase RimI-like enzyme [Pontibacter sp. HSC-36F09]
MQTQASYTFSFLREHDVPALYDTFLAAFADYVIPIKVSREEFAMKFKREGVEPTFCAGAFYGEQLVGFIITGLGEWQGIPTAYNAGTGVLPEHRGNQLTKRLYAFLLPKLRESGVEQCLLEVIKGNAAAFKVYRSIGFGVVRTLECYRSPVRELLLSSEEPALTVVIRPAATPDWKTYTCFCDIRPSWQNTKEAFCKNPDQKLVLEAYAAEQLVGYVAFFPRTGAIAQLAVHPDNRTQGIAKALLREVIKRARVSALLLLNIDQTNAALATFLERVHLKRFLTQHEMLLRL